MIKKRSILSIGIVFCACIALVGGSPAFASAEAEAFDYKEFIREATQMLSEKGEDAAHEMIVDHKTELARHKAELINELGKTPLGPEFARSPLRNLLCTILDVRDIPAVLKRAEADAQAEKEAYWVLCELARRSIIAEVYRTTKQWRAWWNANKYRLDLDPADCRRRALAAAPRYGNDEGIKKLADRMETTYADEAWDIGWALDQIARNALSKKPTPLSAASPFAENLRDGSVNVRRSSAHILKLLQDSRGIDPLSRCLLTDSSTDVRIACIDALESIGKPSAPALIHALDMLVPAEGRLRAQEDVLSRICEALGKIGAAEAVPCLLRILRNENFSGYPQGWVTLAVNEIGFPGIDYLVEHIGQCPGQCTCWTAPITSKPVAIVDLAENIVFSQIVSRWHVAEDKDAKEDELWKRYTPQAPSILARLKELFTNSDPAKRLGAALILTRLGDQDAGRFLVNMIVTGDRAQTRLDVVEVAGYTRSEKLVLVLLESLHGEDIGFAIKAVRALGRIGDPSALPALREALNAPINKHDYSLRESIRKAIQTLEGK